MQENQETWVWALGWEDPLKKEMATRSSMLAWKIPWKEPGRLQSTTRGSKKLDMNEQLSTPVRTEVPIYSWTAAAAKLLQLCPTLCDPIDGLLPGSPVPGILQARTVEWVAISFSSVWKWKVKVKSLSHVGLLATSRTAAYQAPPLMGFSRQEYWSGVPLPSLYSWTVSPYFPSTFPSSLDKHQATFCLNGFAYKPYK